MSCQGFYEENDSKYFSIKHIDHHEERCQELILLTEKRLWSTKKYIYIYDFGIKYPKKVDMPLKSNKERKEKPNPFYTYISYTICKRKVYR